MTAVGTLPTIPSVRLHLPAARGRGAQRAPAGPRCLRSLAGARSQPTARDARRSPRPMRRSSSARTRSATALTISAPSWDGSICTRKGRLPDGFNGYALLPLVSAILYALAMILTRTKCREENPLVLSLGLNVSFVAIGLLATLLIATIGGPGDEAQGTSFLFGEWSIMGKTEWLSMALLAAAVIIGSVGAAIAYQVGPPATVATFDFVYVGFAGVWGVLFFAEVLDGVTITGMALIIAAGVLAVRR